jgi:putative Ca2+/H+ antiporter (TMEM165/GDT1 family)
MDWKALATAFITVFVAELGDKTQLATFSLAAGGTSRWTIFIGSAAALVATSAIAVVAGGAIGRVVNPLWLKRAAGALFIVLGVLYLASTFGTQAQQG